MPRLEPAAKVGQAPAESQPFIRAALFRERNKVRAMIRAARRELAA